MEKVNERELSCYILMDIMKEESYNNIILRKTLNKNNAMSQVQKAFVTEIVNGVLRNIIYLDYVINLFSNTKTSKMKPFILSVLRISVYQLTYMDKVPSSAVCNEAVKLTKKANFINLSGFVNGVLRNILRNISNIELPNEEKEPLQYLSIKYSYPLWLVEKLSLYFNNYEILKKVIIANSLPSNITACINKTKTNKENIINALEKDDVKVSESSFLSNDCIYIKGTSDLTKLSAFKDGLFHIIDESAMLAVKALDPQKGDTVIDICAAPGGKSFYASYLMNNTGKIYSCDIFDHKLELMETSISRLGLDNIKPLLSDGTKFNKKFENLADKVLVDAPCSGLGLVRKKPDIKFAKNIEDIKNLSQIQKNILSNCWKYVKIGGTLVYSTCTLTNEENIDNVNWFIENYPFELENLEGILPKDINTDSKGYVTILPSDFNTDGFFIAKFKRKA